MKRWSKSASGTQSKCVSPCAMGALERENFHAKQLFLILIKKRVPELLFPLLCIKEMITALLFWGHCPFKSIRCTCVIV